MGKGKYTPRSILVRCLVIMAGVVITGFGAAGYVLAALGSDPVTAFVQGMSNQMGGSFGTAMNLFNIVCFVIILFLNRRLIGVGTVLYTFTLGTCSDFFIKHLTSVMGADSALAMRIGLLVIGTLAIGIGLGLYQSAQFGIGPSDAFNQTISQRLHIQLKWERMIFDAIMVAGGFLMGGVVHVGTLVGMFAVGPIMAPTIEKLSGPVGKWAGEESSDG